MDGGGWKVVEAGTRYAEAAQPTSGRGEDLEELVVLNGSYAVRPRIGGGEVEETRGEEETWDAVEGLLLLCSCWVMQHTAQACGIPSASATHH